MKSIKNLFLTLAIVVAAFSVQAQSIIDLRLNEILINNKDNYTDEFSRQVPWVEIYNTAYNSVNVGGCFLTNDTTGFAAAKEDKDALEAFKKKCYNIPSGDPKTLIQQRSSVVFFMDGDPTYGTFHVSFKPEATNYVALISSDGKTLIDLLTFPADLRDTCRSYGCVVDGDTSTIGYLDFFTPGSNNQVLSSGSKADELAKNDPYGIAMAVTAMGIVFTVLAFIYLFLKLFGVFSRMEAKKKAAKDAAAAAPATSAPAVKGGEPTPEELAAIATALDQEFGGTDEEKVAALTALALYLDTNHDYESEVITFGNAGTSTWGQKHFNFKRNPRK